MGVGGNNSLAMSRTQGSLCYIRSKLENRQQTPSISNWNRSITEYSNDLSQADDRERLKFELGDKCLAFFYQNP